METSNPAAAGISASRLHCLNEVMQRHIDEGVMAGANMLIWRRGHLAYFNTFGYMDVAQQRPTQKDTLYRIYSMTKPITSVAIMMLLEDGRLQLNDPVTEYLPELKALKVYIDENKRADLERPLTLWHLLTQTAGLMYPGSVVDAPLESAYRQGMEKLGRDASIQDFIRWLADVPLLNQPGEAWTYSCATRVLGAVVEAISGQRLGDFFQSRIFEPLGMVDTFYEVPADKTDRLGPLYGHAHWVMDSGGAASKMSQPTQIHMGDSDLVSTAADYLRFCQMLYYGGSLDGERILGPRSVDYMRINHLPLELLPLVNAGVVKGGYGFGLGFAVLMDPPRARRLASIGEYNWGGAAGTRFWIDPAEEMIVVMMRQVFHQDEQGQSVPAPDVQSDIYTMVYQALED